MGFEGLLGNEQLKENLRKSVGRGHISHFYLLSGPEGSGKKTLAHLLAAAALCRGEQKPCMSCPSCRKMLSHNHPDCITVEDPDHKAVAVRIVRDARADMYVRPNESDRKVYIFPQEMGIEGQNALLKILEEPPSYGVFILLSDNPESLLPTVRSRCTQLRLLPLPENILRQQLAAQFPQVDSESLSAAIARSGGYLGQALTLLGQNAALDPRTETFGKAFAGRDSYGMLQAIAPMEKWKRDDAIAQWQNWVSLLQAALTCQSGQSATSPLARQLSTARSSRELMDAITILRKVIAYAQGNISVATICGYLIWALK